MLPMTKPSNLANVENGKLPNELLVPAHIPGNNWKLHPTAARACRAMVAAMGAEGIQIRATGTYRSYSGQLNLFLSRYEPTNGVKYFATPSSRRKFWKDAKSAGYDSQYWIMKKLPNGRWPAMAAVPGTSNHGWALAVDFAEELDGDPQVESISNRAVSWLIKNAHTYGWSAEVQSEPWHWRYITGDRIPPAVRTFEVGLQAPPPEPVPPTVDWEAIAQGIARAKTYTLRMGAGGKGKPQGEVDAVKWLQIGLANAKYDVGPADGAFGRKTDAAVRNFQKDRKLLVDGIVGPKTWSRIFP